MEDTSKRYFSVAVSDCGLALTCFISSFLLYEIEDSRIEMVCFALIGVAALAGIVRFGFLPSFLPVHKFLALLATEAVAILCLGIWSYGDDDPVDRTTRLVVCAIILLMCVIPLYFGNYDSFVELFNAAVVGMCLLLVAYQYMSMLDSDEGKLFMVGVGLYLTSSLLVGTKGTCFGSVLRVDVFHLFLIFANGSFTKAILLQRS